MQDMLELDLQLTMFVKVFMSLLGFYIFPVDQVFLNIV